MRIGAIVLARTDSARLPGKVLADVAGRSLLWYVAERIPRDAFDALPVLATTDRAVDDLLAEEGARLGLSIYRGSCDDVAGRLLAAAEAERLDAVVRVNGDSPLLDAGLLARALSTFRAGGVDLVTNLRPRAWPYGVAAEVFSATCLARLLSGSVDPAEREHVTTALYARLPAERIASLAPQGPIDEVAVKMRLTVDTPDDLAAFRAFVARTAAPWRDVTFRDALATDLFGCIKEQA